MTAFDEDPYLGGTRGPAAAPPLEDRISEEKRMQWQVMVANQLGMARAQAFMAGAAERAAQDTFDPSWSPEGQATFKAEMWSGALSPMRVARRKASLPPEDAAAYDEHVAAINVGRAAFDAGAAEAKRLAEARLHWSGQVAAFGMGAASSLDVGGLLTKMLPELKDDLRKLHEMGGQYGQGQSAFGPRVQTGFEDRLIPPERRSDLFFKGASTAYGEALGASPWGNRLAGLLESAGGLTAFVAGPGGALTAGAKAIGVRIAGMTLGKEAIKYGAGKAAAVLTGVAGASVGYGAYSGALPFAADEQDAIDEILEKQGEAAANEAAIKLRALKAGVATLMWPVMELTGGVLGRGAAKQAARGEAEGIGQAAVRGYGQGLGLSTIGAAEDIPRFREISESIIGRAPAVKTSIGRLIVAYQDPNATPEDLANAWIDVGAEVGIGSAVFSGLHAAKAWHATRQGKGRQPDEGGFARTGRTTYDTAARDRIIEEILAKRARAQMAEEAPELANLPALRPVVAEAPDVRLPKLVGGGPMLTKEESLGRGVAPGVAQIEGPKETAPPTEVGEAAALPSEESAQSTTPTVSERREMLAQDEAKPPSGDVAKDAATRWRNDETRWITEQEQTPALAEYQREVDAYEGGEAPKRPSGEPPPAPAKPTEALPGVPLEEPPVKEEARPPMPAGQAGKAPKPGVYRPEETDRAFDIKAGGRTFPVEVRPSDVMKGKVEVSIPSPIGEAEPYVVIARDVREGVTKIAEHWEGTVVPRSRLGEDVVKAAREKAAVERTEAQKKESRLQRAQRILEERTKSIRAEKEARGEKKRDIAARQRKLFEERDAEGQSEVYSGIPLHRIPVIGRLADMLTGPGADVDSRIRYRMSRDLWRKERGAVRRAYNMGLADIDRAMGPSVGHEVREFEHRRRAIEAKVLREFKPYRKEIPRFGPESQAIFDAVEGSITMAQAEAIAGPRAAEIAGKLQRTFEKYRRWWVRVSPQAREMKARVADLGHLIAKGQESITRPGLTDRQISRLRDRIARAESDLARTRTELRDYQKNWGITGGKYMPHFFEEMLRDADFATSHGKLVETLKPKVSIGFGKLKHRTGAEEYIKDIWTALELYSRGFLNKILGERMNRRLERLVYGRKKSIGSLERLAEIQKEGREIYHGPNEVSVEKVDAEAKTVTIRPASAKTDEFDETIPASRARRELTAYRGGLRDIATDRFMEGQFEARMKRILHRQDRYLTSQIDKIVAKVGRGLLNHMYAMVLADPKVAATNFIAGQMASFSHLGAHYYAKGAAMATRAAWGAVQSMMGKKPTGKTLWALEHLRRTGTLSDSEYTEYIGTPQPQLPGKVRNLGSFLKWARDHAPVLFQLVEKINRSGADFGAYLRDTEAFGKSHPEAMQSAYESVARTQFMYMASMSPQFLNLPGARWAFALGQVPFRQWNSIWGTVHEARALDAAKGWSAAEGIRKYLAGESKHWDRPLRYTSASMFADGLLVLLGLYGVSSISHLFGTRLIDITEVMGGNDILEAFEAETGIPKERLIVPGPIGGWSEGGVGVSVVADVWEAMTSPESDRWERLAGQIGPLVISRIPFKSWEYFTAEPIPDRPGFVRTTYPMSGGKTKDMAVEKETLLWEGLAPGSPIRKLRDYYIRQQTRKLAKQEAEWAQERTDLKLRQKELRRAGQHDEAATLQPRIDQLIELTGGDTAASELARKARTKHFGSLERSIMTGTKERRMKNLLVYMKRPETAAQDAEDLYKEITKGGVDGTESETRRAYREALAALRAKGEQR